MSTVREQQTELELTDDERNLVEHLRRVKALGGKIDTDEVDYQLYGMTSTFAALAQMACVIAKMKPKDFKKLATIVQYNGAMWWEWYLRSKNPDEMMEKMDKLGRASSKIGQGLYPLDDETHPINWKQPRVIPRDFEEAMQVWQEHWATSESSE